MKSFFKITLLLLLTSTCVVAQIEDCQEQTEGYDMLLIGNSFFRPYAKKLDELAIQAGFENHSSTRITRGGDNGRPINFWNDSNSNEHLQIKATLDQGNVDFFGMTAGHDPDDRTEGHRAWINYALQSNPDITIFIAIPQIDFPADWDQRAEEFGFDTIEELNDYFVNDLVHDSIVDQLRIEFPSTKIFTVPTGQASFTLDQMLEDNELLDEITRFGPQATSLFVDTKGHQGDIIREVGSLVWLKSIYGVDLSTFEYDTGFNTDLHTIAEDITNAHDEDYKLCFELIKGGKPEVKCDSTYTVILEQDITYAQGLSHDGTSPTTFPIPLKLDVYSPDNDIENRPVYMFIHGGGFSGGSKTQEAIVDQAYYFASRGWVFISIDYRLRGDLGSIFTGIVPQEWFDAASQTNQAGQISAMYMAQRDAKAAMRWIVANADNYKINTDYISVGGGSAGSTTAITLGISNQEDFRDEISLIDDPTLATTNLDQTYEIKSIIDYWGSDTALEVHEILYGTHRFDSNDPPLFIAHGTEDPTVLFTEAEKLVQLYDSTGVNVDFNPLVGRGHGPWGATVDGKSLSDLSFDFLVEQQGLLLDEDCEQGNDDSDLCTTDNRFTEVEYFSEDQIDSQLDVVYATDVIDWQGNTQDLAIDVYYPSASVDTLTKRPFVLLIHGGSFQFGTKESWTRQCELFAQRGYVAATLQYRLGWDTSIPIDQISAVYRANQDAHAAMRFVTENASMFNIDTDAMFIGGGSAGAITALNVVYIDQEEWTTGFSQVISQLGPLMSSGNDLTNTFSLKGVFNNWGSNRANTMQAAEMVPSIAFHGAMDNTVPIGEGSFGASGSGALHELYVANGVCSEITVDPQGGHGIYLDEAGTEFRVARASCFFKSVFCDDCSTSYMEEQVFADCSVNTVVDNDDDGFSAEDDCDDNNPDINPDVTEIEYNGIDDDCDPTTLDDDLDQDGFNLAEDCDDTDATINPSATEIPDNGVDEDCDGSDETDIVDADGDGFDNTIDCDDNNPNINPDATEIAYNGIDDDCNPATLDDDLDQDGFILAEDCDDTNAMINSAQAEIVYNGIDDDCDPATLDDDLDQDGFNLAEDCDDTNASINPDAEEIVNNGIDEDCDGMDLVSSTHEIANSTINIYPNPASHVINIEVEGQLDFEARLYEINGKIIHTVTNEPQLKIASLVNGFYLLEIKDIHTGKRIIERIIVNK